MYKIKVTANSLKDHFRYYMWAYLSSALICVLAFSIVISTMQTSAPADKKLTVFVCGEIASLEGMYELKDGITAQFPEMRAVICDNLFFDANNAGAKTQREKFLGQIVAKAGDVMILPYKEFTDLVTMGAFVALDEDETFKECFDDVDENILKTVRFNMGEKGTHLYAVPLGESDLFSEAYDTSNKVLVLMDYSQNKDNAKLLLKWMWQKINEK